ncbi:MAG: hypothetical protein WD270_13570 [Acetobacterales bacterium]
MTSPTKDPPKGTRSAPDAPRFSGVDGRTRPARRWRRIWLDAASRTPLDARDPIVASRLTAYASACIALEDLAARQARGQWIDEAQIVSLANLQGRCLEQLGFVRKEAG